MAERTISKSSKEIQYLCKTDPFFCAVVDYIGELHYTTDSRPFEFIIDTIIGQMLSNKVADVLSERFRKICCSTLSPKSVASLNIGQLREIGLSTSKAENIINFAKIIEEQPDFFDEICHEPDEVVIRKLTSIRGLGLWSANMYLIFVLDRQDILPVEDGAFAQAVEWLYGINDTTKNKRIYREHFAMWHPYASIAARYMYQLLDRGVTKTDRSKFIHNISDQG